MLYRVSIKSSWYSALIDTMNRGFAEKKFFRHIFLQIDITLKQIELQMPDTTQMEGILKGFQNVIDFY